uniref:Testis-specific protein 10-interacting protein n=1 Tax=Naja naja TaxID=35670 RepID=A0A8C6Y3R0_NAJNA
MLCLATEPEEPGPQKEKRKSKNRGPNPKEELTFKPVINQKVPNFKHLQKRFQEQLEQKKEQASRGKKLKQFIQSGSSFYRPQKDGKLSQHLARKLTVCKPFHLHSSSSQPLSEDDEKKDQEDLFQNLRRLWSLHWRAQSCPDFEPSLGAQVMPTKTSDKRQEANRLLLMEWERREQQEKHRAELRRLKAQHMQREVAKCLATYRNKGYSSASVQRRREELRRQEKQRMEEYMIQLQEIQDRVESRPYLFERVMQTNARQAVERRFSKVLAALGIDEEMLWKHAARQSSGRYGIQDMYQSTESLEEIQNLI